MTAGHSHLWGGGEGGGVIQQSNTSHIQLIARGGKGLNHIVKVIQIKVPHDGSKGSKAIGANESHWRAKHTRSVGGNPQARMNRVPRGGKRRESCTGSTCAGSRTSIVSERSSDKPTKRGNQTIMVRVRRAELSSTSTTINTIILSEESNKGVENNVGISRIAKQSKVRVRAIQVAAVTGARSARPVPDHHPHHPTAGQAEAKP